MHASHLLGLSELSLDSTEKQKTPRKDDPRAGEQIYRTEKGTSKAIRLY